MKKLLFLITMIVTVSTTVTATNENTSANEALMPFYGSTNGNAFIFNEAGVEFSVFADGQFDFFIPNYGPNVEIGFNRPGFAFSFNSGFDYNPYIQYDQFGAVIQIENTPIFYDYYGRINQVGTIFVNYNRFGRLSRIGGLNIIYRNNMFSHYNGFINRFNRGYVYRPWHRFYAAPPAAFCVVNRLPYRQNYEPNRHIYYRPYTNNSRHFAFDGRRANDARNSDRYAQTPRNIRERNVGRAVAQNNTRVATIRNSKNSETRSNPAVSSTRKTTTAGLRNKSSRNRQVVRPTGSATSRTVSASGSTPVRSASVRTSNVSQRAPSKPARSAVNKTKNEPKTVSKSVRVERKNNEGNNSNNRHTRGNI